MFGMVLFATGGILFCAPLNAGHYFSAANDSLGDVDVFKSVAMAVWNLSLVCYSLLCVAR